MKRAFILLAILGSFLSSSAQKEDGHYHGRVIDFPDIPGYMTLTTDFHTHTVFSDGSVWPNIRVEEALRDGLDAISITDHIEYQPHSNDIPHPDRNRSFEIASQAAKDDSLIVIKGAEITRNMPPGHCNAIFLEDVNKINVKDSVKVFDQAKEQGAFVFWNHPNWEAQEKNGMATMTEFHEKLIKENKLQGIEIVNDVTYSDEALQIALDYNLTIMGTSDIHGLVDWHYDVPKGGHRPVTLVFAKEKTEKSLKEALFEKRTVVFFNNMLIGREAFLKPLINASLEVKSAEYNETWAGTTNVAMVKIENKSDAPLILKNTGSINFHDHGEIVVLAPNFVTELRVKPMGHLEEFELKFEVLTAVTAPKTHPEITLKVVIDEEE